MNTTSITDSTIVEPVESTSAEAIETIYTPRGVRRAGVGGWRVMFQELIENRRLIWLLMLRDISVRYRQSLLGYVWAIVPQLATVSVFAFLHASRVFSMGHTRLPYVVYVLWGISVWQLFAGCLAACTMSLASGGSLVTKLNFPRETIVIAAVGQPIFDFLIRLVMVAGAFVWYGITPTWSLILLPLILISVILMALGIGLVLSVANLAIKDTASAIGTTLTIGMFLTPVLYPPPVRWPFTLINVLNPVSPLLTATHDLIALGVIAAPAMFGTAWLLSIVAFLVGWRVFRATMLRAAAYA